MPEVTVADIRAEVERRLKKAREKVRQLEEIMRLLNDVVHGTDVVHGASGRRVGLDLFSEGTTPTTARHRDSESVGRAVRDFVKTAEGPFDVPSIIKAVRPLFPGVSYETISRRASAVLYRLEKKGEIEIIERGYGRDPHTYHRVAGRETLGGQKGG